MKRSQARASWTVLAAAILGYLKEVLPKAPDELAAYIGTQALPDATGDGNNNGTPSAKGGELTSKPVA